MQDGYINGANAVTDSRYDSRTGIVTTVFDASKYTSGTDLAIARTILHESVHAYLVAYFRVDYPSAAKTYSDYLTDWDNARHLDLNELQHDEMVRDMIGNLATTLLLYGQSKGYTIPSQYYSDLVWGGLTDTHAFQSLSPIDQYRIMDVLNTEQNGTDRWGDPTTHKGTSSGCR